MCSDLNLSWLSMSSLFLLPLSSPLTTWGHTRGCHCTHQDRASPALTSSLPNHDTQQPMMFLALAIPVRVQLLLPAHTTGFPMGLRAPRHISMLQGSFPTFPDSSGSHFINIKLCHSPGTAHRVLSSHKFRRCKPLQGKLDTLTGMVFCPRGSCTSVCGDRHRHPRGIQHSFGHCFGWRMSSSPCLCVP